MNNLSLWGTSLCSRLALVNSRRGTQFLVTSPGFGRGAPPRRQSDDSQHPYTPAERERDHASYADVFTWLFDTFAVDPHMAGSDHRLGEGAGLHQTDAVQVTIDSHFFLSFASSAKA